MGKADEFWVKRCSSGGQGRRAGSQYFWVLGKGSGWAQLWGVHHRAGSDQKTLRAALWCGDAGLAWSGRGWAELGAPGGELPFGQLRLRVLEMFLQRRGLGKPQESPLRQ